MILIFPLFCFFVAVMIYSSVTITLAWNYAWTGAGGLSFLQFCNLNSFRTKFILGFSIFMGFSIPQYFNGYTAVNGYGPVHTGARWVFPILQSPYWKCFCSLFSLFQKLRKIGWQTTYAKTVSSSTYLISFLNFHQLFRHKKISDGKQWLFTNFQPLLFLFRKHCI